MIGYKIISSGSVGNAVKLTFPNGIKMMIDIGLSFKALKKELEDCNIVFISHIHADHVNIGCYGQLRKQFPWVKVLASQEVNEFVQAKRKPPVDIVVDHRTHIDVSGVSFTFLDAPHEVKNLGIIGDYEGQHFLYATDLMTLYAFEEYLDETGDKIDLLLLEANYNAKVIGFMEYMKIHNGYDAYSNGSYRHLSTRANNEFAQKYLAPDGVSIHLHQSGSYYSYANLKEKFNLSDEHDLEFEIYCKERSD